MRDALATAGLFDPEVDRAALAPPANLLDGIEAMIASREAAGLYTGRTSYTYRSYKFRLAEGVHAVTGIPETKTLSVMLLSRDLFDRLKERDTRAGISDMLRYAPLRLLLEAWRWMADDPVRWPRVPAPPLVHRDYLPRTARYGRTRAPSVEHMDACLRALGPRVSAETRVGAILMRYTGLRGSQVFSVHREDLDVDGRVLFVRKGKTASEKADQRTIPLSSKLLEEPGVLDWLTLHPAGPVFRKRRLEGRRREGSKVDLPSETLRAAWEAADVPREVWHPPNRRNARPDHAFRAGVQAFFRDEKVDEDVIDFLVGHEAGGVRDAHYGRELDEKARAAVELLPAIGWSGSRS